MWQWQWGSCLALDRGRREVPTCRLLNRSPPNQYDTASCQSRGEGHFPARRERDDATWRSAASGGQCDPHWHGHAARGTLRRAARRGVQVIGERQKGDVLASLLRTSLILRTLYTSSAAILCVTPVPDCCTQHRRGARSARLTRAQVASSTQKRQCARVGRAEPLVRPCRPRLTVAATRSADAWVHCGGDNLRTFAMSRLCPVLAGGGNSES